MGSHKSCYMSPVMGHNYLSSRLTTPLITTHDPPSDGPGLWDEG